MRWMLAALLAVGGFAPVLHAQEAKKGADAKTTKKTASVAVIKIKDMSESPAPPGIFGAQIDTLRSVLGRIKKAAEDKDVKALLLDVQSSPGRGQANELRHAIMAFKKSGKKVYACVEAGDTGSYLVATAADDITMPPQGMLLLTGIRMEMSFYKDLFDKLGVKWDTLQMGDFKNAGEPFSRSSMSEPLKKHMNAILDDLYGQMVENIAEGRKKTADEVQKLIDEGPYTVEGAKAAGLIDRAEYHSDFKARLAKELGVDEVTLKLNYAKKKVDADFDGLPGLMKLLNELAGKDTSRKSTKPRIALLHAVGPIMPGKSGGGGFLDEATMGSDTMVEAVRKIEQDPNIKAIVMRVDSPGGSALASDLIWQALEKSGKPVIVSMGDVAGSGGYYIAMGAEKIFAEPGTITGSIGVIMQKPAWEGLFHKIGINTETLARGKNSGVLASRPWTESEREAMRRLAEDVYKQFTAKAAKGRKMDPAKLESLAGGRIWTGRQAKANGLIDEVGTLEDAVAEARKIAKLDDKSEIEEFPKPGNPFEALFGGSDEDAPKDASVLVAKAAKAFGVEVPKSLKPLMQLFKLQKDPALLVPQMIVEIK
jgi:protease-4